MEFIFILINCLLTTLHFFGGLQFTSVRSVPVDVFAPLAYNLGCASGMTHSRMYAVTFSLLYIPFWIRLSNFHVEKCIGRGAFADVYLAVCVRLRRRVALKKVKVRRITERQEEGIRNSFLFLFPFDVLNLI